ncbi:MAG: primosomal protein N' [Ignavibacteria bacterium]|nr:primosomal protein N' [Ignavibacteria bacterium]
MKSQIAEIVFPLPFEKSFHYLIPEELKDLAKVGVRAVAPFGKRILTGYIIGITDKSNIDKQQLKPIEDILDSKPIFHDKLLEFCRWISEYYFATLGEVLKSAIPYGSDVESKKIIVVDHEPIVNELNKTINKSSNYFKVLEILTSKNEFSLSELKKKFKGSNLNYHLSKLEERGLCSIFVEKQKPKVSIKKENMIILTTAVIKNFSEIITSLEKRAPKQVDVLIALYATPEKKMLQADLLTKTKTTSSILNTLAKKKFISVEEVEIKRQYKELYQEEQKKITLSQEQNNAINVITESIEKEEFKTFLLHGVTASGKTQVYLELINKVIQKGKTAIYLVPEISLTPQVIRRVKNFFGESVGIIHSKLSLGERYDEWRSIVNGEYKIVVGPRSALFSPLKNVGIIIVDEEHDYSYKQSESEPFYNARDSAIVRARIENAVVILGSATPSIESYFNAQQNKYTLIELKNRIDNALLPDITLIDIKSEKEKERLYGVFTQSLIDKIKEKISKGEKTILLQNRRGFATYIICPDCGYTELCKNCSVTLTYHLIKKQYLCHYCGYSMKEHDACPACGSLEIKYKGVGTQRVEDELEQLIQNVQIARMDLDTTQHKGAFSKILSEFAQGRYNILLGTQMVAKGLDFPSVTLVGVISAESNLLFPDFRSAERTFQLLTQVAGRSGRSILKGEVVIQTYNTENYVLNFIKNHDYIGFYNYELKEREISQYPPFYRLALIEFKGKNLQQVNKSAYEFAKLIKYDKKIITVLGPAPAAIAKLHNQYRWHLIIKSNRKLDASGSYLHKVVKLAREEFFKTHRTSNVRILIDIDPVSLT